MRKWGMEYAILGFIVVVIGGMGSSKVLDGSDFSRACWKLYGVLCAVSIRCGQYDFNGKRPNFPSTRLIHSCEGVILC